jgi:hypothetical protein
MVRRFLLLMCVLALTAAASATRIQVSEPACNPNDISVGATALQNGFNTIGPVNGGGSFSFCNNTGQSWTNLVIAIHTDPSITQADVTCPSYNQQTDPTNSAHLAFLSCVVFNPSPGNLDVVLQGTLNFGNMPPVFPGIPNGSEFTIDFNCPVSDSGIQECNGPQDWPPGTISEGFPNFDPTKTLPTVPEPASVVLLATGLAVVWRRKR